MARRVFGFDLNGNELNCKISSISLTLTVLDLVTAGYSRSNICDATLARNLLGGGLHV